MLRHQKIAPLLGLLLMTSCAAQDKAPMASERGESADSVTSLERDTDEAEGNLDKLKTQQPVQIGLHELVKGNQAFAFDLHRALPNTNQVYSPHSISRTLAPLFAGAGGNTAEQIKRTMHFDARERKLHGKFAQLGVELERRAKTQDNKTGFRLKIANHIWAAKDFAFTTQYLKIMENAYRTTPSKLDFAAAPKDALQSINQTINDATAGHIPALLGQDQVRTDTRLILTNAVYFNAPWQIPFPKSSTRTKPFRVSKELSVPVPMMQVTSNFKYSKEDDFELLELPYWGQQVSALFVLPAEGSFADVDRSLSSERLEWLRGRLRSQNVDVSLPRFTLKEHMSLNETLKSLGMTDAFDSAKADFTPMGTSKSDRLFVSDIIHETYLSVDEAGTEAAAATAVVMGEGSARVNSASFVADRPFTMLILDRPTGEILFVARVVNPS